LATWDGSGFSSAAWSISRWRAIKSRFSVHNELLASLIKKVLSGSGFIVLDLHDLIPALLMTR
jgi:hypothetical protein